MAKPKKKAVLTLEERLERALVPEFNQPYPVPGNWCWCYWGASGTFIAGSGFKNEFQGFKNLLIPFYKVGSLKYSDKDGFLYDDSDTIDEEMRKYLKATIIPANSIIFAKIGEAIRLNRRSINLKPACIDNNLIAFTPIACKTRYAYYWSLKTDLYSYTNATTVPAIRKSDLESIPFPIAPPSEQQRIVDRIESLFAKLDEAREKAQAALESFETRKAAILHKAFTGELTAKWREENGVGMDSWINKALGMCGTLERGRSRHRPRNAPELFDGPYPFIQTGDIANADVYIIQHKQTLSEIGLKQSRMFPKGTLCITIAANIGDVAILSYDSCFPDSVVGFTPNHRTDSKFIYYMMSVLQKILEAEAPATAQKNINLKILNDVTFLCPDYPEQKEIVHLLDSFFAKEQKAKELCSVLDKIDLIKKSILARAFRGELDTNDPTEESALELLKSIV